MTTLPHVRTWILLTAAAGMLCCAPSTMAQEDEEGFQFSAEDVTSRLRSAAQGVTGLIADDPIAKLDDVWQEMNHRLDKQIGLRLGMAYTILYQHGTPALDFESASVGDFDLFGTWRLAGERKKNHGHLGFNTEVRHGIGAHPPSDLGNSLGSLWPTASGFTRENFNLTQIWWQQEITDAKLTLRAGKVDQADFYNAGAFTSSNFYFLNEAFASNPTVPFPEQGLGITALYKPWSDVYILGGWGDADARKTDSIDLESFDIKEFFYALEFGWAPLVKNRGRGRYSASFWATQSRSETSRPGGAGFALNFEQRLDKHLMPFIRYGYSDGGATDVRQILTGGVGILNPFGAKHSDMFGIAAAWGQPFEGALRDQYTIETFYRYQLTRNIQLTPDLQVIFNPSGNPVDDVVWVLGVRFRVMF